MTVAARISILPDDRIVFYGDSITEQHLYTALVETFLVCRLPAHRLHFENYGWGGDTAPGGSARFRRDAGQAGASLVVVNFGMNDAGYTGPDAQRLATHVQGQRELAATIAAVGARQVLCTCSAVDPDRNAHLSNYNGTLSGYADAVHDLGRELGLPVIDIFHGYLAAQQAGKAQDPAFTVATDAVHPDEAGHLMMAAQILLRLDLPPALGDLVVTRDQASAANASIRAVERSADGLAFTLDLPYLPWWIPPAARRAVPLLPGLEPLNRFRLGVRGWSDARAVTVHVDGIEIATIAAGDEHWLDLTTCDAAPWAVRGRILWELSRARWSRHYEIWRTFGHGLPAALTELDGWASLRALQGAFAERQMAVLRELAQPQSYRITLTETTVVPITRVELSPSYPFDGSQASFDFAHPPEHSPETVAWRTVDRPTSQLDLAALFGGPLDCVAYARFVVSADRPCRLRLVLGSDDGLTVFVNGASCLARHVFRGCTLGDDTVDLPLQQGANTVLLRITQGTGGWAFAMKATALDDGCVRQITA